MGEKEERKGDRAEQREGYLLRVQAEACANNHPSIGDNWNSCSCLKYESFRESSG